MPDNSIFAPPPPSIEMGKQMLAALLACAMMQEPPRELGALLDRLTDTSISTRDRATQLLAAWGPSVRSHIENYAASPEADPDACARIRILLRYFDLVEAAPPMFRVERRDMLSALALEDWDGVWRDLTALVYDEGLQAGGTPAESLTPERAVQVEWYLSRLLDARAPAKLKARAAVAAARLGRSDLLEPAADRLIEWIPGATDAEVQILQEQMLRFGRDMDDPRILWALREHPRLLLQVNAASWRRRRPEVAEVLTDLLYYPRTLTRDAAAYLLAQAEVYEATPDVAALLDAMKPQASAQLIATAAALNAVEAVPALLAVLEDGPENYADDVGEALIALGPEDVADDLLVLLKTASPNAAIEIIRVLRVARADRAADAIAPLALRGSSPLRLTAVQALEALDAERYRGTIEAGLGDLITEGYAPAIRYKTNAGEIAAVAHRPGPEPPPPPPPAFDGPMDVPKARLMLASASPAARAAAVDALAAEDAVVAVADIARLLDDAEAAVRARAVRALGRLAPGEVIDAADRLVLDVSETVRYETVRVLGRAVAGIPWLRRALEDAEFDVRLAAAEGLARLGQDDGARFILQWFELPGGRRWADAADAIARLGRRDLTPLLRDRLDESRPHSTPTLDMARPALVRALAALSEPGDGPEFFVHLDDPDLNVRRAAIEAICDLGGEGAAARIAECLTHRQGSLRETAARGLQRLPSPDVFGAVSPLLDHELPFVREAAVLALAGHGDPLSRAQVRRMESDPSARVRAAATRSAAD